MVDHDNRLAARAQLAQNGDDGPLGHRVDRGERLVHQIDARILHKGARQKGALLLAAGKLADLALGQVLHADLLQRLHGRSLLLLPGPAHPAEPAVQAHRHHVEHRGREVPVDAAALRHVADQAAHLFVGLAVKLDRARRARNELERGLDQRALARAVRTDDRHQHTLGHAQIDVPDSRPAVVGHRQIVDLQGS